MQAAGRFLFWRIHNFALFCAQLGTRDRELLHQKRAALQDARPRNREMIPDASQIIFRGHIFVNIL